QAGARIDE
ncbi:hypothetical protein MKD33_11820, partial [Chromobacterium piscinae]